MENGKIYKICTVREWENASEAGKYTGSSDDVRDGFIHFSQKHQIAGTLKKHFAGIKGLLLLTIDSEKLNNGLLKWEISRDSEKFPHLYGDLNLDAVIDVEPIPDERKT